MAWGDDPLVKTTSAGSVEWGNEPLVKTPVGNPDTKVNASGGREPSIAAKQADNLPWDVPMTGDQMRAAKEQTQNANETLNSIESTAPEPGLKHLLWSIVGGPLEVAVKGGQSALGERPLPSGMEALQEASLGVTAPVGRGAELAAGQIAKKAGEVKAKNEARQPWTPEQVEAAAKALGAPKVAKAEKIVESRINKTDPTTAQGAIDALNTARNAGKPMMLPDVFQGGVQKLAGRMARSGGEASETITNALRDRNSGSVGRLTGDINEAFGAEGAYDARQALMAARKTAAKPQYDAAYAHPPINPDEMRPDGAIGAMLDRPSVRAGMANARKIAAEEGVDMNTLGIDLNEQGEPILSRVPTWQTLDYMKRGIDNVVEQYRNPTTGKLDLDTYGRAADITRGEFVGTLRDLNDAYGKALDTWGGPSRSLDSIQVGMDALKRSPEQNAARLAEMTPNDREFAKLGIGQVLRDIANKRGPLASEFDRVAGTQYGSKFTREQLRPFFQDEGAYKKFVDAVTAETVMPRTSNRVLGGSPTAERLSEDESPISAGDIAHTALAGALGHHGTFLNRLGHHAQTLWDRRDPELNAEIARILGNTGVTVGRDGKGRIILNPPNQANP